MLNKYPILNKKTLLVATAVTACNLLLTSVVFAGVKHLPMKRSSGNQPITKLEVVAKIKSKYKGRILSVKKQRTYKHPDCYHVKLLEADGEYQLIKVACRKK